MVAALHPRPGGGAAQPRSPSFNLCGHAARRYRSLMSHPGARPYIWMLCGSFSFTLMGVLAHVLLQSNRTCDWQTVAVFRAGIVAVLAVVIALATGVKLVFWPWRLWLRSISGSCSMLCTFYAFDKLPVADVFTLTNTFPIWVALLSWPLYGHSPGLKVLDRRADRRRWRRARGTASLCERKLRRRFGAGGGWLHGCRHARTALVRATSNHWLLWRTSRLSRRGSVSSAAALIGPMRPRPRLSCTGTACRCLNLLGMGARGARRSVVPDAGVLARCTRRRCPSWG